MACQKIILELSGFELSWADFDWWLYFIRLEGKRSFAKFISLLCLLWWLTKRKDHKQIVGFPNEWISQVLIWITQISRKWANSYISFFGKFPNVCLYIFIFDNISCLEQEIIEMVKIYQVTEEWFIPFLSKSIFVEFAWTDLLQKPCLCLSVNDHEIFFKISV